MQRLPISISRTAFWDAVFFNATAPVSRSWESYQSLEFKLAAGFNIHTDRHPEDELHGDKGMERHGFLFSCASPQRHSKGMAYDTVDSSAAGKLLPVIRRRVAGIDMKLPVYTGAFPWNS